MQVMDGLAGVLTLIDQDAVSRFMEPALPRHLRRGSHEITQERVIVPADGRNARHVPARNDEDVGRGLRLQIFEGHHRIRLKHECRLEFARRDPAEYAILIRYLFLFLRLRHPAPRFLSTRKPGSSFPSGRSDSMPELPEVETVRRILHPGIVGQTIVDVIVGDFPGVIASSLEGVEPVASLVGRTFVDTARRGKYLFLHLGEGLTLIVHLRMTGRLLLVPTDEPPVRFEHIALRLDNDLDLRFGDQRKFGRLILAGQEDVDRLDSRLGPEPFASSLTAATLMGTLRRRPGRIKNALLDQRLIAGLGNIYVDEALYRARIHPERPSNSLTIDDVKRVLRAVRLVLNQSLERQGTTFSTFENPYGEAGTNAAFLRAYGRARHGGRCFRCGTPMERIVVGGRGTTFCPRCQVNDAITSNPQSADEPGDSTPLPNRSTE